MACLLDVTIRETIPLFPVTTRHFITNLKLTLLAIINFGNLHNFQLAIHLLTEIVKLISLRVTLKIALTLSYSYVKRSVTNVIAFLIRSQVHQPSWEIINSSQTFSWYYFFPLGKHFFPRSLIPLVKFLHFTNRKLAI